MSLVLCRVDDRLVHGQVVIGWGRPLKADRIILVDDGVHNSPWEQDLYRMAVPGEIEVVFATTGEALLELPRWAEDSSHGILLTGDIGTMAALQQGHPDLVSHINLGGVHHRDDRTKRLNYVFLNPGEEAQLRDMAASGAEITAQDLPTTIPVDLATLAP